MIDGPRLEVPPQMRALAETGAEQARTAFDGLMDLAKRGTDAVRGMGKPMAPGVELYARGLDCAEQSVHATLDHATRLSRASGVQGALRLQIEFLRGRFMAMQAQARDLGGMTVGAVRQGVDGARGMVDGGYRRPF